MKNNEQLPDVEPYKCPNCNGVTFETVYMLVELSAVAPNNPTGKDTLKTVPTFRCCNCKEIPERLNPLESDNSDDEDDSFEQQIMDK